MPVPHAPDCPACVVERETGEKASIAAHRWQAPTPEEAKAAFDALPPVVQCSMLGHPWPLWEYVVAVDVGKDDDLHVGFYRRQCPRCKNVEVRSSGSWWV